MKKAYMFTLDVTIAILIILIGTALLYYNYDQQVNTIPVTKQLSEDIIGVMFYTEISDVCNDPGLPTCNCPKYNKLADIVCNNHISNYNTNLLSMISELIETSSVDGDMVKEIIREIFVTNNVIDEKRFGFSVLYTDFITGMPLELYNTETY